MIDTLLLWGWRFTSVILPFAIIGFIVQTRPEDAVAFGAVMAFFASVVNTLFLR